MKSWARYGVYVVAAVWGIAAVAWGLVGIEVVSNVLTKTTSFGGEILYSISNVVLVPVALVYAATCAAVSWWSDRPVGWRVTVAYAAFVGAWFGAYLWFVYAVPPAGYHEVYDLMVDLERAEYSTTVSTLIVLGYVAWVLLHLGAGVAMALQTRARLMEAPAPVRVDVEIPEKTLVGVAPTGPLELGGVFVDESSESKSGRPDPCELVEFEVRSKDGESLEGRVEAEKVREEQRDGAAVDVLDVKWVPDDELAAGATYRAEVADAEWSTERQAPEFGRAREFSFRTSA